MFAVILSVSFLLKIAAAVSLKRNLLFRIPDFLFVYTSMMMGRIMGLLFVFCQI